ncbi:GGDEF domain-containing protein [Pseudohongiella spirulinae]|uniref:diguanylate cyclase n=1 Tax=Pseudohongiella spirulinae TaxID=1249552 RepID=A0A0S2KGC0_9GAMM|nr:GGDEF domain-containing protein [Pseudohongiella spirulinae]ALO47357.1 Diguanylate cyclase (GGDEF) domain-containing protein [Pseudohongiella spirulinae]
MTEQDQQTKAQQLRLRRTLWGVAFQVSTALVVFGLYLFEMLPLTPVLIYMVAIALTSASFVTLIRTGRNLRFTDPSMTAAQIVAPLWPAILVMFFVTEPQVRTAFLLTATSGLVFGMFALSRTGMLMLSLVIVGSYLLLLIALSVWAPERIDWRIETILVFAYTAVLVTISYLTSYIAGLRNTLREQNLRLNDLVCRDPLTDLPNRRSLMEQLAQETSRIDRRSTDRQQLCISMLDIDYFKRVNDTWGHDVGDAVLRKVGAILTRSMRKGDFVGRFGGEEFIMILPESSLETATMFAQRICQTIADAHFAELPDGEKITVSQGVTEYLNGEHIDATIKRADDALYEAKHAGRNQIIIKAATTPA